MATQSKTYSRTIFTKTVPYNKLIDLGKATEGDIILDKSDGCAGVLYTHNTSFLFMDPSLLDWYDMLYDKIDNAVFYDDADKTTITLDNVIFKTLQIGHTDATGDNIDTILSVGFDDGGHKYNASFWDDVNVHIELLWVKPKDIGDNVYEPINVYDSIIKLQDDNNDVSTRLDNIKLVYDTELPEDLLTITQIGGIAANTTVESLKGKTFTSIIDDLLFPTIQPTITNYSISFTLSNTVREVGTAAPTITNFSKSENRGKATIGSKYVNYAGPVTNTIIYYDNNSSNTTLPTYVKHGTTTYTYSVTFAPGEILKDSKNNTANATLNSGFKNPFPGDTSTKSINVIGRYPLYANKTNITSYDKLPVSNDASIIIKVTDETDTNKQVIKVPQAYTVEKLELLNTLSGNYEIYDINTKFKKTTENINVNARATSIPYNVYTRNDGKNGAATFKIYLTY